MRRATGLILQRHQILHLPRKMTLMSDVRHIWNLIYNARSNSTHPPTSPNTVPATQNDSHEWCPSHLKRHLHCAEQQDSSSNVIKYCTCHAKWLSWVMSVTYETSFTMRGATSLALQPHQMLRLPRKMTRMIDPRDIWNVIYNARNNRHHPPTSPNTAPATQNCIPKSKKNLPKTVEASIPMRGRFDHDPTMIRPWTRHLAPARSPRLLLALRRRILYWKLQHFTLRLSTQISPNTVPATKSDTPTSPNAAPATKSDTPTSPNTAPATKSSSPRWPNTAPAMKSDTELLLDCTLTCYLTWIVALLSCYLTELSEQLLHCCYLTELLLDWAVTSLPLLYWAVTLLSCYFTELLLYWAVTLLNCYFTELLLYWAVTLLSCFFTELLLYWAVTAFLNLRNSEVSQLNFLWLYICSILFDKIYDRCSHKSG